MEKHHTVTVEGINALTRSIDDGGQEIPGISFCDTAEYQALCARLFGTTTDVVIHCVASGVWDPEHKNKKRLFYATGNVGRNPMFRFLLFAETQFFKNKLIMASYDSGPAVAVYNDIPHR